MGTYVLSHEGYESCRKLNEAYVNALLIMKTPVSKPNFSSASSDYVDVFTIKQQKFQSALEEILKHLLVIKSNKSKLSQVFTNEKENAQNYLLGLTEEVSTHDGTKLLFESFQNQENDVVYPQSQESKNEFNSEILELKNELKRRNDHLNKLKNELISFTSS